MKANELMIGDWVQIVEPCKYAGAIGRIKTLIDHKDDENAYFKVFLRNNTIHIGIEDICSDDIRPILLTPEILEKNGFRKMRWESNAYVNNESEAAYICFSIGNYINLWGGGDQDHVWVTVKYVHQFQHALKFCRIETTIEL